MNKISFIFQPLSYDQDGNKSVVLTTATLMTKMRPRLELGILIVLILDFPARTLSQEERQLPRWRPFIESQTSRITTYNGGSLREKLIERNLAPPGNES